MGRRNPHMPVDGARRVRPRDDAPRVARSRPRTTLLLAGRVLTPEDPAAAHAARRHLTVGFAKLIAELIADGSLDPAEID